MKAVAAFAVCALSCLVAGCRYERLTFAQQPIALPKSEVLELRNPTGSPRLTVVRIKGPPGGPEVTVLRPSAHMIAPHLRELHEVCATAAPTSDASFLRVSPKRRMLADYAGAEALQYETHWAYIDPQICARPEPWIPSQPPPAYFLCASRQSESLCARDLFRDSYSAYFFVDSDDVAVLRTTEKRVVEYLDRVIVISK